MVSGWTRPRAAAQARSVVVRSVPGAVSGPYATGVRSRTQSGRWRFDDVRTMFSLTGVDNSSGNGQAGTGSVQFDAKNFYIKGLTVCLETDESYVPSGNRSRHKVSMMVARLFHA